MTSANERERKSATVRARIEPSLKEAAERILDGIGLDPTTVVTALYRQIVARNGMPFEFELTEGRTRKPIQAVRRCDAEEPSPGRIRAEAPAAEAQPETPEESPPQEPVVRKVRRVRDSDDSPLPFPD